MDEYWLTGRLFADSDALVPAGVLQELAFCEVCGRCVLYDQWRDSLMQESAEVRRALDPEQRAAFSPEQQPPAAVLRAHHAQRVVHAERCPLRQQQQRAMSAQCK